MVQCEICEAFVPHASSLCPNCQIPSALGTKSKTHRQVKTAATVVTAGMISMTLMACYGAPPDYFERSGDTQEEPCTDENPKPTTKEKEPKRVVDK